jgi:3-oxoacyl-[acyl-carrier protein] reductase
LLNLIVQLQRSSNLRLKNRVALVLGAIKGIGKAIALDLADQGVHLALTYYDWPESLAALEQALDEVKSRHKLYPIDLLETERIPEVVKQIAEDFGGIDILINNIERGGWPVVHGPYNRAQWDLEMATTLRAKRWVFDAALPFLKESGSGAVINLSSIAAQVGRSGPAGLIFNDGYAAANRGVSLLTETWARMGAPEVRVNEIMLGFVATRHGEGTRGWGLLNDGQKRALRQHTLLRRFGTLDDVVKAINFLLTGAPFMTGGLLRLDGGYVLGGDQVPPMPQGVL